jgi:tRNA (guanosine-2'-O-)-methyltransferase
VQHVHLVGPREELAVNRAITCGCEKWLDLHRHPNGAVCAQALHEQGFGLWAAVPDRAAQPLETLDFGAKVALVFGGEHAGLSDELLSACDGRYQIPMPGFSQSLNSGRSRSARPIMDRRRRSPPRARASAQLISTEFSPRLHNEHDK